MKPILVLIALAIKLFDLSLMALGLIVVPLMLHFNCDMSKTWWGNKDHPEGGKGVPLWYWFAIRNPTFNFGKYVLGIKFRPYTHAGDTGIGDLVGKAGSYWCFALPYFEYYLIKPIGFGRCLRIRIGWKLYGKSDGDTCAFCFVIHFPKYQQ